MTRRLTTMFLAGRQTGLVPRPNQPYTSMGIGVPPHPNTAAFLAWVERYRLQALANVPLARALTYYFAQLGDDTTGDGSQANPWKTFAKAQEVLDAAGATADLRLRFNCGDVWRGLDSLTVNKHKVTVDSYGSGAKPIFTRFTLTYSRTWENDRDNTWWVSEPNAVAWVRKGSEQGAVTTIDPLKEEDTLANCRDFEKSWFYDAINLILYVNTGGPDPNDIDYEAVPVGTSGWSVGADNVRFENLELAGYGMHSGGYGIQINRAPSSGVYEFVGKDLDVVYSGYHAIGQTDNGQTHRVTLQNCRVGYCKNRQALSVNDVNPFVSFSTSGQHEYGQFECEVLAGGLPSVEWSAVVGSQLGSAGTYMHTGTGGTYPKLALSRATRFPANAWQVRQTSAIGGPPSGSDDVTEARAWVVGEQPESPNVLQPIGTGTLDRVWINCTSTYNFDSTFGVRVIDCIGDGARSWCYNCTLTVSYINTAGTPGQLWFEPTNDSPFNSIMENCLIRITGVDSYGYYCLAGRHGSRARWRNCGITAEAAVPGAGALFTANNVTIPVGTFDHCAYAAPNDLAAEARTEYFRAGNGAVLYPVGGAIPGNAPGTGDPRYGAGMAISLEYDNAEATRSVTRHDIGAKVGVPSAPAAPTSLAASPAGSGQLYLSWTRPLAGGVPYVGSLTYNVYRGTAAGAESTTPVATGVSVENFADTGLAHGATYYYKVKAVGVDGTSPYSAEASCALPDIAGLPSLSVWIEAATGNFTDTARTTPAVAGDPVKGVTNLAGANHPSQATTGNAPVRRSAGGGKWYWETATAGRWFDLPAAILSGATSGTLVLAVRNNNDPAVDGAAADSGLWDMTASVETFPATHFPFLDGHVYEAAGSTIRKDLGDPTPSLALWRVYTVVSAANDYRVYLGGSLIYSTGTNTVGWSAAPMLGRSIGAYFHNGRIAAMLAGKATWGLSDRAKAEAWAAALTPGTGT